MFSKWTSEAGPIQTKRVQKALSRLKMKSESTVELTGIIGLPDTERRSQLWPMCTHTVTEENQSKIQALHDKYSGMITRDNCKELETDIATTSESLVLPVEDLRRTQEVVADRNKETAEREAQRQVHATKCLEHFEAIKAKAPVGVEFVIVAQEEIDDSDSMTDYFNVKHGRTVAIGFRTGKRESFRQLREAAACFAETEHLGPDAPGTIEHRENYSMGSGNYLKGSGRYSTGWAVRSLPLSDRYWSHGEPLEDAIPPKAEPIQSDTRYSIVEHHHTKRNTVIYIVCLADRVETAEFETLRHSAKQAGGWYSRAWHGSPGGFAFGTATEAGTWAADTFSGQDPVADLNNATAERFRETANKATEAAEAKEAPRRENTWKQRHQAANAREDAANLRHGARACNALADVWEDGTIAGTLQHWTPAKAREAMRKGNIAGVDGRYIQGNEYADQTMEARELQVFADAEGVSGIATSEDLRKQAEREEIKRMKIPGFFPTPPAICTMMVERAELGWGYRVLEPSAGIGSLADAIAKVTGPGAIDCVEINRQLREIVAEKYATIGQEDFLKLQPDGVLYDAVVMNPPFEKRQDQEHIRHAWDFLKEGGILVALCSPGAVTDQRSGLFTDWLDEIGAEYHEEVEGFETTKVRARLVVATK
jgi:protein-L-isoaspartate O-methyltransferase